MSWNVELFVVVVIFVENPNVGKVASHSVEVETEADDEFRGYFKANVVGSDRLLYGLRFEEKGGNFNFSRIFCFEVADEFCNRIASVDDIFDDYNGAAFNVVGQIEYLLDIAGGVSSFVAFEANEGYFGIGIKCAEEVGSKRKCTVKNA